MDMDTHEHHENDWELVDVAEGGLDFEAPSHRSIALKLLDTLIEDMSRGATAWPHRLAEIRDVLATEVQK